jgi:hypothetical protein
MRDRTTAGIAIAIIGGLLLVIGIDGSARMGARISGDLCGEQVRTSLTPEGTEVTTFSNTICDDPASWLTLGLIGLGVLVGGVVLIVKPLRKTTSVQK